MEEKKNDELSKVERLEKERQGKGSSAVEQLQKERVDRKDYFKSGGGFDPELYGKKMDEREAARDARKEENAKKYEEQKAGKAGVQERPDTKQDMKGSGNLRGGSGRGGGSLMTNPDDMIKDDHDVIKPHDILSQQKPQQQQQKSAGKTQEEKPKINSREWMAKMLEANSPKEKENTKTVAKDTAKANIKGLIDKAVVDRNNAPAEKTVSKEKSKEVAMNITKTAPPKTIKR